MLDHLPEQYRIGAIRWGQRWVSTARCRAARLTSEGPFDAVDHVVGYLFAQVLDASRPSLVLAAPFEAVVPFAWDRAVPG